MSLRVAPRALLLGVLTPCALAAQATTPAAPPVASAASAAPSKRPMTFLDAQRLAQVGPPSASPDGKWVLYPVATPDWKEARSQTDLYLVSAAQGVSSTRRLTFTTDKNEVNPRWAQDGSFFVFASNRDAPASAPGSGAGAAPGSPGAGQQQLYLMRADGGEARKITNARDGVSSFEFSRDGKWLVYRSGKADEEQLHAIAVAGLAANRPLDSLSAAALTRHPTGVGLWRFSRDAKRIYFVTADTVDRDEKMRAEKRFTVQVRNAARPASSLWALDLDTRKTTRLTRDTSYSVTGFTLSDDGRWLGFTGTANDRYKRNVTEEGIHADVFLLETATGAIERLTDNSEVAESPLSFSPDSRTIAFSSSDDPTRYNMKNRRLYVRAVDAKGQPFRKLGTGFDGDVGADFWSPDGRTVYFNEGLKATQQLFALDVASGNVRQVTSEAGVVNADRDDQSGRLFVQYSDPTTPSSLFTVASVADIGRRARWTRLTDANPWVRDLALGEESEVSWRSRDGKVVGGVLLKPVGYTPGRRYPLIVAIHGGPAAADLLSFNGGYGAQAYAGAGWVVLMPNYRGSTNYGEAHKTGIVGNYFAPGFDDIMTGVDTLIAQGMVDSTRMGVLGWSAGGHWSNWILTHTDRFKAISSGAGTSNWISMYAQSDVQRNRQFYLGDKLPYEDFDAYWNQSPIKYIRNAKTPTMIHVVDGDPRVPRPQSEELHMALKRLGVPTEFYVYPGNTHGIPDPRNRLVKSMAEMAWMNHYVLGSGPKFAWRDVLKTLEDAPATAGAAPAVSAAGGAGGNDAP